MPDSESRWSSVNDEIAKLLPEIPREDRRSPIAEIPGDQVLLSDAPSGTYRWVRAALVVSGAAVAISILSPYFAWFAALITW